MEKIRKGFTLIEIAAALGVLGTLALIGMNEEKFEAAQVGARALGNEIFQYNSAVSRYVAAHSASPGSITGSYIGSDWLKGGECGGSAGKNYIACAYVPDGRTVQFQSEPTTNITETSEGALTARTVWSPAINNQGQEDSTVMGIAAMVASGSYISQAEDGAAGYQAPTVFCPDITTYSASIDALCGSDKNRIVSTATTNSTIQPWLRTDHGNTMRHVMEFDDGAGEPSTIAELEAVDDGGAVGDWGGAGWRQIVNVARIYNQGSTGNDSIVIGKMGGDNIYTDSFVTANTLLKNALIVDGNAGVMGDLYVKMNAYVDGNIEAKGDISSEKNITAGNDLLANRDVSAGRDVKATRNMHAKNDIRADRYSYSKRHYDADNTSKYIDPGSRSQVNAITATGDMRATRFYDQNNTGFYTDPASRSRVNAITATGDMRATRFYDQNNTGYYTDPASTSRLNAVDANSVVSRGRLKTNEFLHLNRSVSNGGGCSSNGLVGRLSDGTLASCVSGRWKAGSGTDGYVNNFTSTGNTGSRKNSSSRGQFVNAYTSRSGRDCAISGWTSATGRVAEYIMSKKEYSQNCKISFMVPPGASWSINASGYGTPLLITTWVYQF